MLDKKNVFICWSCGAEHDTHSEVGGEGGVPPSDGDVSVCFKCAELGVFAADKVVKPSDEVVAELKADAASWEMITKTQDKIRKFRNPDTENPNSHLFN